MSVRSDQNLTPTDSPPAEALLRIAMSGMLAQALAVAAQLGIADLLADGPRSSAALAASAGSPSMPRSWLRRASG